MPVRVTHLLDDLEARLGKAYRDIAALREENRQLRADLALRDAPDRENWPASSANSHTRPADDAAAAIAENANTEKTLMEHANPDALNTNTADDNNTAEAPQAPAKEAEAPVPPSPRALLEQWHGRYPQAFANDHVRPLKIGIHQDLARHEPWSKKLIRRALACYVNRPSYTRAVRKDAARIDLDGNPAGTVDEIAAQAAEEKRRRAMSAKRQKTDLQKDEASSRKRQAKKRQAKSAATSEAPAAEHKKQKPDRQLDRQKSAPKAAEPLSMDEKLASLQRRFGN